MSAKTDVGDIGFGILLGGGLLIAVMGSVKECEASDDPCARTVKATWRSASSSPARR